MGQVINRKRINSGMFVTHLWVEVAHKTAAVGDDEYMLLGNDLKQVTIDNFLTNDLYVQLFLELSLGILTILHLSRYARRAAPTHRGR